MTRKKLTAVAAALALMTAAFAAPALARRGDDDRGNGHGRGKTRPAQTRMRFKLDDHQLALGEAATGQVTLLTRDGKQWVPLAGATLGVVIDGHLSDDVEDGVEAADTEGDDFDCGSVTTDAEGHATASCLATAEGEYVMRVRYAGDETHKRAKRAQGFTVGADAEDDDDVVTPTPTPTPTETTI